MVPSQYQRRNGCFVTQCSGWDPNSIETDGPPQRFALGDCTRPGSAAPDESSLLIVAVQGKKRLLVVRIVRHEDIFGAGQRAMEGRQRFLLVIRWNDDREDVHKGLITGLTPTRYYSIGQKVCPAPGRYGNGLPRYSATVETPLPSRKATSAPTMIFMGQNLAFGILRTNRSGAGWPSPRRRSAH